jgi:hypothetical protein
VQILNRDDRREGIHRWRCPMAEDD